MKKIGIITITSGEFSDKFNYGNKLQNYALQTKIESLGFKSETILYQSVIPDYTKEISSKSKYNFKLNQIIIDIIRIIKRKIFKKKIEYLTSMRIEKFKEFNKKYINFSKKIYKHGEKLDNILDNYDLFVAGSDQIWNPYFEGYDGFYFMDFAPTEKKITYAPSIGVDTIPNEIKEEYKKRIEKIDHITIREEVGKKILKQEFNVDALLVCDPVFLISESKWQKLCVKNSIEDKYICVYILGKKSYKTQKQIRKISKKLKAKIIDIYTWDSPNSQFAGPNEFLTLIKNCECMITDSFHGTAFSIIFNKPVVIVDRNEVNKKSKYNMSGRIENLMHIVDIGEENKIENIYNNPKQIFNLKYNKKNLQKLIDDSTKYLELSLNEKDKKYER